MRRMRGLALPGLLVAMMAGPLAPAAEAKRGPCIPGQKKPTCRIWTAKVFTVADGDTFNAKIREGGRWSKRKDIRLLGVQAMELTDYSRARGRKGECHAVEAAERLEYLLQGPKVKRRIVRIASFRQSSKTAGARGRLRRGVAYKSGGRWHDAGAVLMREGHAIWDPNGQEWAWNGLYSKLAAQAARDGKRIWDPDSCSSGPDQESVLDLKLKWDANGNDGRNVNGEWVRVTNTDPVNDVSLRGWYLRDAYLRRYEFPNRFKFPRAAIVPAGGSIQLHVGKGKDTPTDYYWGEPDAIFQNVKGGEKKGVGDGAYLYDPDGDLRAWTQYPCRLNCSDPAKGRVRITAHKTPPESVRVTNTSNVTLDLAEYEVETSPWFYEFGPRTALAPRQSIVVVVERSPARDTVFTKGWGLNSFVLADKRDVVTLRNPLGTPITCVAWGGGMRCPRG